MKQGPVTSMLVSHRTQLRHDTSKQLIIMSQSQWTQACHSRCQACIRGERLDTLSTKCKELCRSRKFLNSTVHSCDMWTKAWHSTQLSLYSEGAASFHSVQDSELSPGIALTKPLWQDTFAGITREYIVACGSKRLFSREVCLLHITTIEV